MPNGIFVPMSAVGVFGDIDGNGSTTASNFSASSFDFDNFFAGGIGFGRYITPNVRLGLDLDYRHYTSSTYNVGTPTAVQLTNLGTIPLEVNSTSLMLNAVYDFTPSRRFSPYVGGGIGWAFHNLELKGSSYTNDVDLADGTAETGLVSSGGSSSSSAFAANVMAGVSVNIRKGLFLDVGYKFSYLGDADVDFRVSHNGTAGYTSAANIELEDLMTHEFKVGLRYDLY